MTKTTTTKLETTGTDIATLPPADRAVIVLDSKKAEEQLRAMLAESTDIHEVKDKDSRTMAHNAAMKLKNARVAIEKTGKAARDDANAFSKAVIAEENRLKAIITTEEDRLFKLRDTYDQQVEAERLERERKEQARIANLQGIITAINRLPMDSANDEAAVIQATMNDLSAMEISDDFAEFKADAEQAKATALQALQVLFNAATTREHENARLKAESERLAALRAEEEKKLQAERDKLATERAELEALRAQLNQKAAELNKDQEVSTEPDQNHEHGTEPLLFCEEMEDGDSQSVEIEPDPVEDPVAVMQSVPTLPKDADGFVAELAKYTAMQFDAMAEKVRIVAAAAATPELRDNFEAFATELHNVAVDLTAGQFNDALMNADWNALGNADKVIALASYAGVALHFGEQEMGGSVLMQAAE